MRFWLRWLILVLLSVVFSVAGSSVISVNDNVEKLEHFSLLYFKGTADTPQQVRKIFLDGNGVKQISNAFAFGYDPADHWFHFVLSNRSDTTQKYVLYFTEQFHHHVDLYVYANKRWYSEKNGISVPMNERKIKTADPAFRLMLKPHEKQEIYLHIQSPYSIYGAFCLQKPSHFYEVYYFKREIYALFFGAMLSLALFNLFIFFYLRKKVFFYYVGYVTVFTFWAAEYRGFLTPYVNMAQFDMMQTSVPLFFIFLVLYSQQILETKHYFPRIHNVLNGAAVLFGLSLVWMLFDIRGGVMLMNFVTTPIIPMLFVVSAVSAYKNRTIAKIYMVAMLVFMGGMSTISFMSLGLAEYTVYLSGIPVATTLIEAILFSLLLAYYINMLNKETTEAKEALIRQQRTEKSRLFREVAEKTSALNQANRRLHRELEEVKRLEEILQHQANSDSLTGLMNRRAFTEAFEKEIERASRSGMPLTCMLIDIDFFKKINDTYGHHVGDEVIRKVAELMRTSTRSMDQLARIGGEEFTILMPDTPLEDAHQLAERLRSMTEKTKMMISGKVITITICIGITERKKHEQSYQTMMQRSDDALYHAKESGRNRVCVR